MDMRNLDAQQQMAIFKTQQLTQVMLSDAAAENAAAQFNATSENQVTQFYDGLKVQVNQFNASQSNALSQFNVSQDNAFSQFNASQMNQRDQFNAQNRLIVDQSNAEWRRNIATANTAAQNRANEINAQNALAVSMAEYNNQWQAYRDNMQFAFTAGENDLDRENRLAIATLQKEGMIEAAKAQRTAGAYQAAGAVTAAILGKTTIAGDIATWAINSIKGFTSNIASIDNAGLNDMEADMYGGYDYFVTTPAPG
jgi:hypothetical protein